VTGPFSPEQEARIRELISDAAMSSATRFQRWCVDGHAVWTDWNPYGGGFSRATRVWVAYVYSDEDVVAGAVVAEPLTVDGPLRVVRIASFENDTLRERFGAWVETVVPVAHILIDWRAGPGDFPAAATVLQANDLQVDAGCARFARDLERFLRGEADTPEAVAIAAALNIAQVQKADVGRADA